MLCSLLPGTLIDQAVMLCLLPLRRVVRPKAFSTQWCNHGIIIKVCVNLWKRTQ